MDTAGVDENRGEIYALWARFSNATAFSLLGGVKSVIVVINYQQTLTNPRGGVEVLAQKLVDTFGDSDTSKPFWESMCFVFTHPFQEGHMIKIDGIKRQVGKILNQREQDAKHILDRRAPRPDDMDKLRSLAVQIKLLKAITAENSRCFVSNPTSHEACRKQRDDINKMIAGGRLVTKAELAAYVATQDTGAFQIISRLAALASLYAPT